MPSSKTITEASELENGTVWDIETLPVQKTLTCRCFFLIPFMALITLVCYWAYFACRVKCLVGLNSTENVERMKGGSWFVLAVELGMSVPSALNGCFHFAGLLRKQRPSLFLRSENTPRVDILITCCGEDIDVILDTVRGALSVDFPKNSFRVVVLDDGPSLCLGTAIRHARKKGPLKDFKAGNINHGIRYCASLPTPAAPIIAALDADMIPDRRWLRALVPHLLVDDKLAFACPPQLFYNIPKNDILQQNLAVFAKVTEPVKDSFGTAMCQGTGYVLRREAAVQVGGFPVSVSEDLCFSSILQGAGWQTAYVQEPLQCGMVPESYASHVKQRVRWGIGVVDTAFKMNFYLCGSKTLLLTIVHRFILSTGPLLALANIPLVICGLGLPIAFICGYPLVIFSSSDELRMLVRLSFGIVSSQYLLDSAIGIQAGFRTAMRESWYHAWMSPYMASALIRNFFLPTWLGGETTGFKPTGSLLDDIHERSTNRASLHYRIYNSLWGCQVWFHLTYIMVCFVSLGLAVRRGCQMDIVNASFQMLQSDALQHKQLVYLLTHTFWPPLLIYSGIISYSIPVIYTIFPPTVPPRGDLTEETEDGNRKPREDRKGAQFSNWNIGVEYHRTFILLYSSVIFALSWMI